MAFQTFHENFLAEGAPYAAFNDWPSWLPKTAHDIEGLLGAPFMRRMLQNLRGKVDLICGGPPCQGFSVGGIRDGNDHRNRLVDRMVDFVQLVEPTVVLIENVLGFTRRFISKPGASKLSVADEVVERLSSMGYVCEIIEVDASRFGVPQIRHRALIVATRRISFDASSQEGTIAAEIEHARIDMLKSLQLLGNLPVTVHSAIDDLDGKDTIVCPDSPKFFAGTYKRADSAYARAMRRGINSTTAPNSHRFSHHGESILKLYRQAHRTQPFGRLSKSFLLTSGTKKDKKVLLDPHLPSSTITTHPDEFIHYAHPRNVTVREMARLQSFPDDFNFYGRYTINGPRRRFDVARCSQVGNSVPPLVALAIGLAVERFLAKNVAPVADESPLEMVEAV